MAGSETEDTGRATVPLELADTELTEPTDTEAAQRIIRLLWDPPATTPPRGPRPKIGLTDVITAGVAIADQEGLASLSMRKVASRLGVGAMSLYTYVPGRDELIELMVDRVHGELTLPAADLPGEPASSIR